MQLVCCQLPGGSLGLWVEETCSQTGCRSARTAWVLKTRRSAPATAAPEGVSGRGPGIQCLHLAKEGCCLWGPKWLRVTAPSLGPLGSCSGSLPALYHGRYLSDLEKLKAGRKVLVLTNGKKKLTCASPMPALQYL